MVQVLTLISVVVDQLLAGGEQHLRAVAVAPANVTSCGALQSDRVQREVERSIVRAPSSRTKTCCGSPQAGDAEKKIRRPSPEMAVQPPRQIDVDPLPITAPHGSAAPASLTPTGRSVEPEHLVGPAARDAPGVGGQQGAVGLEDRMLQVRGGIHQDEAIVAVATAA